MKPSTQDEQPGPSEKKLYTWSKPLEQAEPPPSLPGQPNKDANATDDPNSRPTLSAAVSTIKPGDFLNVPNMPCAQQGLLTGISSGFGIGAIRFMTRGSFLTIGNWAVGAFVIGGAAGYEYCLYNKQQERVRLKRQIEITNGLKQDELKAQAEKKQQQERLEQQQKALAEAKKKQWYKFW